MAVIKTELRPFPVPDFVREDKGSLLDTHSLPLKGLPADTLRELCDEFVVAVFKKAGKSLNDEPATEFQELMTAIEKDAYKAAHILYEDGVRAEDV